MQYFKNTELAKLYPTSEAAVRRWIEATRAGKLDLQLYESGGRSYIANTTRNLHLIEELVERGKEKINKRLNKTVEPTREFYKLYNSKQIADIIANIDIHHEIPLQYNYFGETGAQWWDKYAHKLWTESEENMLTATVDLLRSNFENILRAIKGYERVNVVDVGIGNALPIKELLTQLLYEHDVLARYIAIDISPQMLTVAQRNLEQWFDDRIPFEGYIRDITHERFDDLLIDEDPSTTVNLVLLLGGTLQNFRSQDEVLNTIYNSMGRQDVFINGAKLDVSESRRYFDLITEEPKMPRLILGLEHELNLFGIDPSLYDVEQDFDDAKRMRYSRIRLNKNVTLKFTLNGRVRPIEMKKGDTLLVWRYWHLSTLEYINLLSGNGFSLIGSSLTNDKQFMLTISRLDPNPQLSHD